MTKGPLKVLIIGSGPAGYTAAIYAARAGLNPVLLTGGEPGGQLTTTNDVENFPGYPDGVNGPQMMVDLQKQAERFGTEVHYKLVTAVDFSTYPFTLTIDGKEELTAESVIIATGASAKYLGLPSEKTFANKGVSACAVCDGYFYRGKEVAVVGAGDSAAEESTYLAKLCPKVHLLVRRDEMRASKIMQQRVLNTPNIEVHWNTEAEEILGDDTGVKGVRVVDNKTGEKKEIAIEGFFLAIGHKPNTDIFKGQIDMDGSGYIKVKPGTSKTNVEGVFAVGDAADKVYRQAVTAAGTGCMGALDAEKFLAAKEAEAVQ
ncbi:MAG: thioredoxin-disulfide reductase [Cyclobacteriaceae bacterium]|nr:thioredoxin-disulfide reductase [Cyclobacteriaceae bacterium]MCB0500048.1 thioredoxin-disulfide reductase [Cyclobacteriaceae bacterium]MCB9239350.1 thioredoxin-disulfide reductase [Flammeovirgaceae bacterium]MCO5271337.1 thioredoxin-disulfide reductase [Cyclobacteriaceae bacterium]MCW5903660.1 thioredoxin-disulfide reductase [Cyclobacteriaceae bacterium]